MERRDQGGLTCYYRVVKLPQFLAAELQRPGCPRLEEDALAFYNGGEVHNQLGESSALTYKVVKHASLSTTSNFAAGGVGAGG